MFVSSNAEVHGWGETLKLHNELVVCIGAGDALGAIRCIERHMDNALKGALHTFGDNDVKTPDSRTGLRVLEGVVQRRDRELTADAAGGIAPRVVLERVT